MEMWFSHVFSGSWLFLKVSLEDLKFLILKKLDLSVFILLWSILFCVLSKKSWSNPSSQRFSLMFSSRYFKFQLLLLGIWFILIYFCVWYKVRFKIFLPAHGYLIFPTSFVWRLFFLHWITLTPLSETSCPYMCGSIWILFCSFNLYAYP